MPHTPGSSDPMTPFQRLMRRRRFLIHKKLQYQLLLGTLWHVVLILVIAVAILFVPLMVQLATNDPNSDAALRAANHLLYLHGRFWPTLVLVAVFIGLDALRTSHRIAGPLLRFSRALEVVREGRIPKTIVLREGDFLLEECARINEAIELAEARSLEREEAQAALLASTETVRELLLDAPNTLTNEQKAALEDLIVRAEGIDRRGERAA
ncbi:MAG: hypothetical protein KDA27_01175 [Candidatus Eisenbacteria bacterium]|uniref:HAMP domain-containing protein n=1 Tax=Eiseniibacteriota bacterium TaxID=2212470 RepID=A0A956SBH2_UNCEI|nr:hypothetical protein [Candidatus Eisenbacteria bacterium]MCB9466261.1 hypothetical protein [Candidatus Eisenbacteria bacterium]